MITFLVRSLFDLFYLLIIARIIVSWVRPKVSDPRVIRVLRLLYEVTEPVLSPIRNLIERYTSSQLPLDFSPLIVLILMPFVESIVVGIIRFIF